MEHYYSIAGLRLLAVYEGGGGYFKKRMAQYECEPFGKADISVYYTFTDENPALPEDAAPCGGGSIVSYYTTNGGYALCNVDKTLGMTNLACANAGWSRIDITLRRLEDVICGIDEVDTRRMFFMLGTCMETAVLFFGRMVLHASSIAHKGEGLCVSAASGMGKSTHTGLWRKTRGSVIVNDDKPIISFEDGKPYLCGSPWAGTTGINTNIIVPLRAVVVLSRAEENSISPLSQTLAIHRILKESPHQCLPEAALLFLERVDALVGSVPVYGLKCNITPEAVDTVEERIWSK